MALEAGDVATTKGRAFERRSSHADGECSHGHMPIGVRSERRQKAAARQHVGLKPMRFVSLHHHTTFSYLDGFQMPEAHVRRATEINMGAIAWTEHGNISSHVKGEAATQKQGVKSIFGCEVYTGRVGKDATQKKYHLTILAATQEGYRNLLQLVSKSYAEGFHHEPTVSWQMLKQHRRGLIVLSGCQGSLLFCSAVGGKLIEPEDASLERAVKVARQFKKVFGDAYYIEVQAFPELAETVRFNKMAPEIARRVGAKLVGTMDCHYTAPEEAEIQKVLHNVRPGNKRTLEDQVRDWGYNVPLCPPPTDKSIYRRLVGTGLTRDQALEAIISTEEVAQRCDVTLPKLPELRFPLPDGWTDSVAYWRHMLKQGWKYRGFDKLPRAEQRRAKAMFKHEMKIIEDKGFHEYLLIVQDFVLFAKDSGIPVGPARGSAAASICCYALRITEINPLMFPDLVFERFIDVTRADPPDIDLDFDSDQRWKIREYGVAKYGSECVNNIGTFTYYKSKLALDDVAKVHRVPPYEVEKVKELLIERSSGDLRSSATIEDTVEQFEAAAEVVGEYPELAMAMDLEGNVKQGGVHAAGLVVSNGDIREVCAVYEREVPKGSGNVLQVISMDKYDAERQGLLKLDFLGLSTMAMIAEALRQLDMSLEDLYSLPLDDEKVIDAFRRNDVVGIFQFDGQAARIVNGALKPDNFDEICDVIALCRPGPLHSQATNDYIEAKQGSKVPQSLHPSLDAITLHTHRQIVYQEQILQIVTKIGNFDWTHASHIRRIISKKLGEQEFSRQWKRFWAGAKDYHKRNGGEPITEEVARAIWGYCITSGSYAFNSAHCRSYGMLGYWSQWLKQYHPPVFYASSLAKMPDKKPKGQKQDSKIKLGYHATLMRDAVKHGISLRPPHPKRSGVSWQATGRKVLRAGFNEIPKVGPSKAEALVAYREENGVEGWEDFLNVTGVGDTTVQRMREFAKQDDPFGVHHLDNLLENMKKFAGENGLPQPTHLASDIPPQKGRDEEVVWIGIGLSRNLRDIFESHRARTGEELDEAKVKHPELNEYVLINGYDGTEVVRLKIDRFKYGRFRKVAWSLKLAHDVLLVQGVKPGWRAAREIYIKHMWVIDPEEE